MKAIFSYHVIQYHTSLFSDSLYFVLFHHYLKNWIEKRTNGPTLIYLMMGQIMGSRWKCMKTGKTVQISEKSIPQRKINANFFVKQSYSMIFGKIETAFLASDVHENYDKETNRSHTSTSLLYLFL